MKSGWWTGCCLAFILLTTTDSQARLAWNAFEQYQSPTRLLRFDAVSTAAVGTLLIWPELGQMHHWLSMAEHWQQRGWNFILLLPDPAQQSFDPASEQPTESQRQWLEQEASRLSEALAELESSPPLLVMAQGCAALWYQQLVDSATLPPPDGLMLMDALPAPLAQQKMLAMSLARSPYPVLDIYSRPSRPLSWHNQQQRQQELARREKTGYAVQHIDDLGRLGKFISSWLVRQGWLPLPPGAPDYLKEQRHEAGISGPQDPGTGH